MTESKEIQVQEKQEVASSAEHTKTGLFFKPVVDIFETEEEITVLADMPGVKSEDINIDLRDNTLTLTGEAASSGNPGEEILAAEYETGTYYRQFSLSGAIDQGKIDANIKNGVLRLILPKIEKAKPRKITVKAA